MTYSALLIVSICFGVCICALKKTKRLLDEEVPLEKETQRVLEMLKRKLKELEEGSDEPREPKQ